MHPAHPRALPLAIVYHPCVFLRRYFSPLVVTPSARVYFKREGLADVAEAPIT